MPLANQADISDNSLHNKMSTTAIITCKTYQ